MNMISQTPPRNRKRNQHVLSSSSPYRTPSKRTPSSKHTTDSRLPRMSPSPRLFGTPSKSNSAASGDRFIPSRRQMNIELCRRTLLSEDKESDSAKTGNDHGEAARKIIVKKEFNRQMLSSLCNIPSESLNENSKPKSFLSFALQEEEMSTPGSKTRTCDPYSHDILRVLRGIQYPRNLASSLNTKEGKCLRILDAPNVPDDYYLDLMSWGEDNILAVALEDELYLYEEDTGCVDLLMRVTNDEYISSVSWCRSPGSKHILSIGFGSGRVELWDCYELRRIRIYTEQIDRVSCLAWSQQGLTSAGKGLQILQHDPRSSNVIRRYRGHLNEVCGLKWNEDGSTLASGDNGDLLCLWDARMYREGPRLYLRNHTAAVKALDWCPFQRGMLASGGGTADKTIKLWDSNSGKLLSSIYTGSQVSGLIWSSHSRELCSSHGYNSHELVLWRFNGKLEMMKNFTGHTQRVLGIEASPDGRRVASIGSDEQLRLWDVFTPPTRSTEGLTLLGEPSFGVPNLR